MWSGHIAARPKGQKKKDHVVTATDAEWARICEAAGTAGMPLSHFILHIFHAWLASTGIKDDGLPASVYRRMVQSVFILEHLEQQRLKNQDAEHLWQDYVAKADARIDTEVAGMQSSECNQQAAVGYGSLPASLLRMMVRAVLVLELLERQRLKIQHAPDLWPDLVAKADAWIDAETALG